ncbi:acyl carrier protein [Streptomyces cellulosae]
MGPRRGPWTTQQSYRLVVDSCTVRPCLKQPPPRPSGPRSATASSTVTPRSPAARPASTTSTSPPAGRSSAPSTAATCWPSWRPCKTAGPVDADTDFFAMGGTSLGAVQLIRLVKQEFGLTLRLRDFLLTPTAAHVRHLVEDLGRADDQ